MGIGKLVKANKNIQRRVAERYPAIFQQPSYYDELVNRITGDIEAKSSPHVLEVGGVDRPLLKRSPNYEYIGVDIDDKPHGLSVYDQFITQSIEEPLPMTVDVIISKTLMEHVPDNRAAVKVMYDSLNSGGVMHHYIPSKWHPYSICLRLVGHKMQNKLIKMLRPEAADVTGYPAFFNRCSPGAMRRVFETSGFSDVRVDAYYQASGYFSFFYPFYLLVFGFERLCKRLNLQVLASGFIISASRK